MTNFQNASYGLRIGDTEAKIKKELPVVNTRFQIYLVKLII